MVSARTPQEQLVLDFFRVLSSGDLEWKDLVDGQVLGGEDAVEAFEGEGSFTVEEVRYMGLNASLWAKQ